MDAARQVLRFSIPGSLVLLNAVATIVITRIVIGDPLDVTVSRIGANVSAPVGVLAAIPVGFVAFQIYYVSYRATLWPFSRARHPWVRLDRGSQVLSLLEPEELDRIAEAFRVGRGPSPIPDPAVRKLPYLDASKPYERAERGIAGALGVLRLTDDYIRNAAVERPSSTGEPCEAGEQGRPSRAQRKDALRRYRDRWQDNWAILRALVDLSEARADTASIKRDYLVLADFYHALGAARTAMWLGWWLCVGATTYDLLHGGQELVPSIGGVAAGAISTAAIVLVLHSTRRQTWESARQALWFDLARVFQSQDRFSRITDVDGDH